MLRNISILVLCACLSLPTFAQEKKKNIEVRDIWASGLFQQAYVHGLRSMNSGEFYTSLKNDRGGNMIVKSSYKSGKEVGPIVNSNELIPDGTPAGIRIDDYQFSANEKKLLLATETEHIYRHSTREKNYVYDLKSKQLSLLSEGKQRYATFSPQGDKVAFVRDNNLFVKNLETGDEQQITKDGKFNEIINGATDWVYEEEFAFDKAFFWSPSGNKIAYYRFDETKVREFNMAMYGKLYPKDYRFKYPKAGEDNSVVTIHIHDLEKGATAKADLGKYEYIPRIKWTRSDDKLAVIKMNRYQSILKLFLVNSSTGEADQILMEGNKTYIDIHDNLTFLEGNSHFLWTSELGGYNHIYMYTINGREKVAITKGDWEVTEVYGLNEKDGVIYFQAAKESPLQREIYSVKTDGSELTKLSKQTGTNNAHFSKGFKYFINNYSNANTPAYFTLNKADGEEIRVLEDNARLKEAMGIFPLTKKEFFKFKTSEGSELNGWMMKPLDFDPNKKYPVLMYVYGGPGSQTVTDSYGGTNYMWYQMLAQKGYLVVSVDNRGTGARGEEFKKLTYKQLGKYETMDQISAAKYLQTLSYVDPARVGIWGWSYGGYMSSLCMFKGADVFKMGIAVAPVTNWKYYDSIYTERYMQTPKENPGYDENSPITHVKGLEGKYLLVHGTADDNVHYQNSVEMVTALQDANKQFDLMLYPNKNHGIYGGTARLHLYTLMTNYIEKNL